MRRKDREILDRRKMEVILDTTPVMHLGLWDGKEVYVAPLNFVRIGEALYFHSAQEGRKIDILSSNPRVCFEVTGEHWIEPGLHGADCTTRYQSVIGWGIAKIVEDIDIKRDVLVSLNKKFAAPAEGLPEDVVRRTAIIKIEIERMTGKSNRGSM